MLPKVVIFAAAASNGYGFAAIAQIPPDEEGESIGIYVSRGDGLVTYSAPATVTSETIEADLGRLGTISVTRVATDRKRKVQRGCRPGRTKRVRAQHYEGTIEFHGEESFAEVSADRAPLQYIPISCFGDEGSWPAGKKLPGARLDAARSRPLKYRYNFNAEQRRPGARSDFFAEVMEIRDEMEIHRATWTRGPSRTMRYDRDLRTATVRPPAPFSGAATFRAGAPRAKQWTGNLTVDLPGRSGVRLTGPGFGADLEHARS